MPIAAAMTFKVRGLVAGLVLGVLSGSVSAQKLTINPGQLTAGGQAVINYSNPQTPGAIVIVVVDGPVFPAHQVVEVAIQLDDNGNGGTKWPVPNWPFARFNAFGVGEMVRSIMPGESSSDSGG